ncbi:hypothetical protein Adi01nite_68490 [Amorphoplanes digitatis]|nr:hypothetical protein GCM10020092_005190 [Actinoplanes digitatis]GID97437.1 hypothetical protein Adi01nite_68490 [Actinoplanes digitatis]
MLPIQAFLLGTAGGLLAELVAVSKYRLTKFEKWPSYIRGRAYWIMGFLWVATGGALACMYNAQSPLPVLVCVNIGASAPLIVRTLMQPGTTGPGVVNIEDASQAGGQPA